MKISDYYISLFNDLNYGLVFDVLEKHYDDFSRNNLKQVCVKIAREYKGIGVYHSHQTSKINGKYHPHVHLLLYIPEEKQAVFIEGNDKDLKKANCGYMFKITKTGERKIHNWRNYLRYCLGDWRTFEPEEIWCLPQVSSRVSDKKQVSQR